MAQLVTETCDRHPTKPLIYDCKLGNRNAGPAVITLPAGYHDLKLCSSCMTELVEWIGVRPFDGCTGTLTGQEKLFYLEIVDDDEAKPPTVRATARRLRPEFKAGADEEDERYWDQ